MSPVLRAILLLSTSACVGGPDKANPNEHCGDLNADEVWTPDEGAHVVTCPLTVDGASLRVEAGVEVLFADDAGLSVGCDAAATLTVAGTAEEPARFTSESGISGSWTYLLFCSGAQDSQLSYAEILQAGAYDNFHEPSALIVAGGLLGVDHVSVSDSSGQGFTLADGGRFAPGSAALVSTGNDDDAGSADADSIDSIPTDGDYTGNAFDLIRLASERFTRSATWEDLGVPLYLGGGLTMEGEPGTPASLSVGPGVTLDFGGGRALTVGTANHPAELHLAGSAEAPVRLTNSSSPGRGAWEGVSLASNTLAATFDQVDIGYARDGVRINGVGASIDHALLHDSTCGLSLLAGANPTLGEVSYRDNETDLCE